MKSSKCRLKPSQIIFERHFGVHGDCYIIKAGRFGSSSLQLCSCSSALLNHFVRLFDLSALKVAVIQIMTVLLQAFGKAVVLTNRRKDASGAPQNFRDHTKCSQYTSKRLNQCNPRRAGRTPAQVPLLGGTVAFAMHQNIPAASPLKRYFWIFCALLAFNSLYPSILFVRPDSRWCRYGSSE